MKPTTLQKTLMAGILLPFALLTYGPKADGQAFEVLHTFEGPDGAEPWSALIQGSDGNFYGSTGFGGDLTLGYNGEGLGTIFKMTPDGTLTTLVVFEGSNGSNPGPENDLGPMAESASLVEGDDGNYYGTTGSGGDLSLNFGGWGWWGGGVGGAGTIFKMAPDGTLTTLVQFEINPGCDPSGPLIKGSDGNLYGTTLGVPEYPDGGTVFQLRTNGILRTLTTFYYVDGAGFAYPSDLVQGSDGNFYGLTATGKLFKLTPTGARTTLPFANANGLVGSGDGNSLYLTISGNSTDCGTLFNMTLGGKLTTIASFGGTNGCNPGSGFILRDGNYFGTTSGGGDYGYGTAFEVTPDGKFTTLFSFDQTNSPAAGAPLMQGSDGNLYGTTVFGGDLSLNFGNGNGTVFRLVMPPPPPTLTIAQDGNQLVLSWPTNAAGFVLETADSLSSSTTWSTNLDTPIIIGGQNTITVSNPAGSKFYRLQK